MSSSKEKYEELCEKEELVPLFLRYDWYNSILQEKDWDVVIHEESGECLGFFVYYRKNSMGLRTLKNPPLTPYSGLWIKERPSQKLNTRVRFEHKIIEALINRLPNFHLLIISVQPIYRNLLAFNWNGFSEKNKYTYVLENLNSMDKVFSDFKGSLRTDIRKAEKLVTVSESTDIKSLFELNRIDFDIKKKKLDYDLDYVSQVYAVASKYNSARIFMAHDDNGELNSAILIVWDSHAVYYLMGASDRKFLSNSSLSLLLWEAIKFASGLSLPFNFEGSMIKSIEKYFSSYGAHQVKYSEIKKNRLIPRQLKKFL